MIDLIQEDLIFFEDGKECVDIFKSVAKKLYDKEIVTADFSDALIEREKNYPTGMDLFVVHNDPRVPNIAIPHAEAAYCHTKNVVLVQLKHAVPFKNMINPEQEVAVHFLFIILNDEQDAQVNILANIMDFANDKQNMLALLETSDAGDIRRLFNPVG